MCGGLSPLAVGPRTPLSKPRPRHKTRQTRSGGPNWANPGALWQRSNGCPATTRGGVLAERVGGERDDLPRRAPGPGLPRRRDGGRFLQRAGLDLFAAGCRQACERGLPAPGPDCAGGDSRPCAIVGSGETEAGSRLQTTAGLRADPGLYRVRVAAESREGKGREGTRAREPATAPASVIIH